MFIRKSLHKAEISRKNCTIERLERENNRLKEELKESKDLKKILEAVGKITDDYSGVLALSGSGSLSTAYEDIENSLSDAIPRYVDDIFGGKVIKQEATKAIVISKDGEIKTGLTKQKAEKGYSYVLVQN